MAAPSASVVDSDYSAGYAASVTKSDATVLPATRGLYVGGAGDVAVSMAADDSSVTFSSVPAGTILPVRVKKVLSTGTTATLVVALW
jgi:hypothetical protein